MHKVRLIEMGLTNINREPTGDIQRQYDTFSSLLDFMSGMEGKEAEFFLSRLCETLSDHIKPSDTYALAKAFAESLEVAWDASFDKKNYTDWDPLPRACDMKVSPEEIMPAYERVTAKLDELNAIAYAKEDIQSSIMFAAVKYSITPAVAVEIEANLDEMIAEEEEAD